MAYNKPKVVFFRPYLNIEGKSFIQTVKTDVFLRCLPIDDAQCWTTNRTVSEFQFFHHQIIANLLQNATEKVRFLKA